MKHGKTRKKRALGWYLFAFMRVLPVFDPWLGFWCIMKITWRQWLKNVLAGRTKPRRKGRRCVRPTLEALEDRTLPSGVFPFVESINRTTPAGPATNAASVAYTVTFSEPVTGVNPTDFQLATTGTVGTTLTQVTPPGPAAVYTVTVSGITGNGTLGLNLVDNGAIRDLAGDGLVQANAPFALQAQQTFPVGSVPRTVALGDLNGDGKPDLAVTSEAGTVSVLLGNGNGTFQAQQIFATGSFPFSVALRDVNGDGKPDLTVGNEGSNTVSVLLGNGNGTFQAQEAFATGSYPKSLALGDLNGDGQPDLAVGNYGGTNTASVLLGNGNGTFQAPQAFATGSGAISVALDDANGDGKPDLAVANRNSDTVSVLLGNGNGTFQAQQAFATGTSPVAVALSDVNGDGIPDLAVANYNSYTVSVLLGNGNGTFQGQQTFAAGSRPLSVALGDVNGDGKPDIAVANLGERFAYDSSVSVLLGNGNGTFQGQETFAAGSAPFSVALGDVNGDGRPDLVVGSSSTGPAASVLVNALNGNFTSQVYTIDTVAPFVQSINRTTPAGPATNATSVSYTVTFSKPVTGVDPADFTLALTGSAAATTPVVVSGTGAVYTVTVSGITGNGTLGLNLVDNNSIRDLAGNPLTQQNAPAAFQAQQTFATGNEPQSVAVADLTGDGNADLVVANRQSYSISVLLGNGNGTFQTQTTLPTGARAVSVAVADLNGDGKPDLVVYVYRGVSVFLGNGNGTFQNPITTNAPHFYGNIALADVNGDGKPDLIFIPFRGHGVSVLLGNGNGTFQSPTNFATERYGSPDAFAVADVNGDGKPDLVAFNPYYSYGSNQHGGDTVSVLLGNGNGTFQSPTKFPTGGGNEGSPSLAVADMNGDGRPDIVVALDNAGGGYVLLGNGDGTFQSPTLFASATNPTTSLVVVDVNGDGKPDLVEGSYYGRYPFNGTISILLGNGDGTFQNPTTFATGAITRSVAVGDFNGDGRPDLAVANYGSNTVSVLLNAGNDNFTGQVYTIVNPIHLTVTAASATIAGNPLPFFVTALDQSNNTFAGYTGTVQFTSSDPEALWSSSTATLSSGVGFFAATLKTAGNQTIIATDTLTSSITGASNTITVSAAAANHFGVVVAPLPSYATVPAAYLTIPAAPTSFASTYYPITFTVTALDPYGNTDPTYAGTVTFSSSDSIASLPFNTTLTSGVGTFGATLVTPGNQTLSATDTVSGITGTTSPIVTRGLVVTAFTLTPSGFTVAFNEPFNPSAINLYTSASLPDDVMLATLGSQVSVRGSVLFNADDTGFTFVKTVVASAVGTFNPGSGLLTAGTYTVTLRGGSMGVNGLQDALGGPLDGTDSGIPGSNYRITFAVKTPPVAVGIPDFARGPSNTDALFLPASIGNGNTFNLIYNNPNTTPTTGTATVTFSTIAATLEANIQNALNALPQIGTAALNVPNAVAVIDNPVTMATQGANVLVTFQNSAFVTATNQVLASTTPGVSIALATINAANDLTGNGIPVALSSGLNVTSGSFTLQYNPSLLTINGAVSKIPGAAFTLSTTINNATSATAVLSLSSPSSISSTIASLTIGSLLATVPFSATASYGAMQLLHFSAEQLNGTAGPITVTNQDAVEVAAFFGDVNDTGMPFPSSGAVGAISIVAGENPNVIMQTLPGFVAFPTLDPVIIGEVNLNGLPYITALDINKMNQQLTVGQPTIPWLPAGLTVTTGGADPTLSISRMSEVGSPMSTKSGANIGLPTSDFRLPTSDLRLFAVNIDTVLQDSAASGPDDADLAGLEPFFARHQRRSR